MVTPVTPEVSAGGTATWEWTASYPSVTESQAGSYVVMDNFHGAMVGDFEHAVTVLATVISRPPHRVIVDAGNKSMGAPALASIRGYDLPSFRFDEEHGIFAAPAHAAIGVGDVVELIPGYAPRTVNWYDAYHVVCRVHGLEASPPSLPGARRGSRSRCRDRAAGRQRPRRGGSPMAVADETLHLASGAKGRLVERANAKRR